MSKKRTKAHKTVTFLLGFVFLSTVILIVLLVGFNFKKIAVSLNLPFDLPASWYSDEETASRTISIQNSDSSGIKGTADWFDGYLKWFLVTDFDEFTEPSKAKSEQLIYFGIVTAANSEKAEGYQRDENFSAVIPAEDVHAFVNTMLDGVKITDKTVGDFVYNAAGKSYKVPSMGINPAHISFITGVKNISNEIAEVSVSFFPFDELSANKNIPTGNPEKTMVIKLKKEGDLYKILSYVKTNQ